MTTAIGELFGRPRSDPTDTGGHRGRPDQAQVGILERAGDHAHAVDLLALLHEPCDERGDLVAGGVGEALQPDAGHHGGVVVEAPLHLLLEGAEELGIPQLGADIRLAADELDWDAPAEPGRGKAAENEIVAWNDQKFS